MSYLSASTTNINFIYDCAEGVQNISDSNDIYTQEAPGSLIFQNISGTATANENESNVYKGIYIVDKTGEDAATTLIPIFTNRLHNYSCPTATGNDLNINDNDSIQEAIGKLHKAMIDFEYVMAAALNDINIRLNKLNV